MAGPGGTFFGLIVKPNKRYDTTVKETFRVTKACLEPATHAGKTTSLHVEVDSEEYIIANFDSKHLNEPLDLGFTKGETISFKVEGPGVVHVTGNIMEEDDDDMMDGMMMDDESEEEEMPELVAGKRKKGAADASPAKKVKTSQPVNGTEDSSDDDDDDDDDDSSSEEGADTSLGDLDDTANFAEEEESDDDSDGDDDDDDSSEEESPAKAPVLNGKAKKLNGSVKETPTKKGDAIAALKKNKDEKTPKKDTPAAETKTPKQEGKSPKKEAKTPKQEGKTPKQDGKTPKETKTPKEGKTPKQDVKTPNAKTPKQEASAAVATPKSVKKTMKGGIAIEEIKEGTGPEAKSGRVVGMFYSGRLKSNNKQFDACQSGKPFKFKLGKGEVIKGWDIGVQGLKVGGKRKLTIPPQMGYGSAGAPPDIPPNSTLVFEVECKYVN